MTPSRLVVDEIDGFLLVRLDCTSATIVGVVGRALNAAAAAADDSDEDDAWRKNAEAAAVAAFGFAVSFVSGCGDKVYAISTENPLGTNASEGIIIDSTKNCVVIDMITTLDSFGAIKYSMS